ncbi:glycoside hydrolase family 16 protein [Plectosphaerella plurivora]|uniref:Glycoside hydrolase family 16 protein n=1 Tax=Plectosphaerella plurivora TaxID=936078 RepID=A0A9P8VHD1_9PEZI|nr:glycoside hydrolase family 16 protein [Plectosphaerella plurivora]
MRPSCALPIFILGAAAASSPLWQSSFSGPAGASPDWSAWDAVLAINTNGDIQEYTNSPANLQLSGHDTLRIIPRKDPATGRWTSGRIESKGAWAPPPGRRLKIQGDLRLGAGAPGLRQGLWPAFWVLGDDMRHGRPWPVCGEMDIFEHRNSDAVVHGVMHCGTIPETAPNWHGGVCNEPLGRKSSTGFHDLHNWHTWALVWDRTSGDWRKETITWFMNGTPFHTVDGNSIGDEAVWASLAHKKFYIILNVAIGGTFPGMPNDQTQHGEAGMLEVRNLGVYEE